VFCRALEVEPSTFYKLLNRPRTQIQVRRWAIDAEVRRAFVESRRTYRAPRERAQLPRDDLSMSKKTVKASMVHQGLCARPSIERVVYSVSGVSNTNHREGEQDDGKTKTMTGQVVQGQQPSQTIKQPIKNVVKHS